MSADTSLQRHRIEALIPHKGGMCLWDEVLHWDTQGLRLRTAGHRDPAHPLCRDGRLSAVHLCEYGAQAMAVHGGLCAQAAGGAAKTGVLVALREVRLGLAWIDELPGDLECDAELLADGAGSQQYAFRLSHGGAVIAEGRAAVMLQG